MNKESQASSIDQQTAQRVADISRAAGAEAKVVVDHRENETKIFITYRNGIVVKERDG